MSDLKIRDKIITPGIDKASIFNAFLKSFFTNKNNFLACFKTNCDSTIISIYSTEEKVKKKLKSLDLDKSPEADNLHHRVWKENYYKAARMHFYHLPGLPL